MKVTPAVPDCHAIVRIQPVRYERKFETFGGDRIATQLYWPPERGIIEDSSAMTNACINTPTNTIGNVII